MIGIAAGAFRSTFGPGIRGIGEIKEISEAGAAREAQVRDGSADRRRAARRVIISNGLKNFHLSSAASEADKRGALVALFCGLFPKRWIRAALAATGLGRLQKAGKLLGRTVDIDERKVCIFLAAELLGDFGLLALRYRSTKIYGSRLSAYSMRKFADSAARWLRRSQTPCEIYHYRAGYGLSSLSVAKRQGAILLCDHSIAHPLTLDALIEDGGILKRLTDRAQLEPFWKHVLDDIEQADHVVVNSSFVRETFRRVRFPLDKLTVIYLGVDDVFLRSIPPRQEKKSQEPLRFLFAGSFSDRKGAKILLDAILRLPSEGWTLQLAGTIELQLENALRDVESKCPVEHLGNLTREQLASAMTQADVFVFPSLAEGSARVIFEAMACGCFIVTTPNSGSIVEDGVHGRVVAPGDVDMLTCALVATIDDPSVASIGEANARLIQQDYRQHAYGERMAELYERLAQAKTTA
jgi:glycosyltransferase involved in cell wall biosynthesis